MYSYDKYLYDQLKYERDMDGYSYDEYLYSQLKYDQDLKKYYYRENHKYRYDYANYLLKRAYLNRRSKIHDYSKIPVEIVTTKISDIFNSKENNGKSLVLEDKIGIWMISNNGQQLKRIHNDEKLSLIPPIISYWYTLSYSSITYYMTNGHKFVLSNEKGVFLLRGNDNEQISYEKFEFK